MNVVVYGLGIIGASLCASLKRAGHKVYARNRSREPVEYALSHGIIDGEVKDFSNAEVVFLALPPQVTARVLDVENFPNGAIVADICGVKACLEEVVYKRARNYRYVGTHPMAGKETRGITSSSVDLFKGANFVVTACDKTDECAAETIISLAKDMGFGRIVRCTASEHDKMIALTSQLAHVLSNAYIKSPSTKNCKGFTGGSFQDVTRVATLDEKVWTELFFSNQEYLLDELNGLIARLSAYRNALAAGDEEEMRKLLREGCNFHAEFFKGE